jgi:hypothetical protein
LTDELNGTIRAPSRLQGDCEIDQTADARLTAVSGRQTDLWKKKFLIETRFHYYVVKLVLLLSQVSAGAEPCGGKEGTGIDDHTSSGGDRAP